MPSLRSRSGPPTPVLVSEVIVKIVIVFLVAMGVLAVFGRFRFPGQKRLSEARCKRCGRYRIGKGPCSCERDKLK